MGLVNNRYFLGAAESACLENATPNQITGLVYSSHVVVQGVAMVAKLHPIKTAANFSRTQNYVIIGQTHFSSSDGWSLGTRLVKGRTISYEALLKLKAMLQVDLLNLPSCFR